MLVPAMTALIAGASDGAVDERGAWRASARKDTGSVVGAGDELQRRAATVNVRTKKL